MRQNGLMIGRSVGAEVGDEFIPVPAFLIRGTYSPAALFSKANHLVLYHIAK